MYIKPEPYPQPQRYDCPRDWDNHEVRSSLRLSSQTPVATCCRIYLESIGDCKLTFSYLYMLYST